MTTLSAVELVAALRKASTFWVDGFPAEYRTTTGKPLIQMQLFNSSRLEGTKPTGQFLADPEQLIWIDHGEAKFCDSLGFNHDLVLYKDQRMDVEDIRDATTFVTDTDDYYKPTLAVALAAAKVVQVDGLPSMYHDPGGVPRVLFLVYENEHSDVCMNSFMADPNQQFIYNTKGEGLIVDNAGITHSIRLFKSVPVTKADIEQASQMLADAINGPSEQKG